MESKKVKQVLEFVEKYSQEKCPFCDGMRYPVKGKLSGYEKVEPYEAQEWRTNHSQDCPMSILEEELNLEEKVEHHKILKETIGLLNCMIDCGEEQSEISRNLVRKALDILNG